MYIQHTSIHVHVGIAICEQTTTSKGTVNRNKSLNSIVNYGVLLKNDHNQPPNQPCREKTCLRVSDQVRHKPGCAATEDG